MIKYVSPGGKRVVMLVLNEVTHDTRVRNEAAALAEAGYQVCVIGTHDASSPLPDQETAGLWLLRRFRYGSELEILRRFPPLKRLRHVFQGLALLRYLRRQPADIWHAHDFPALVMVALARLSQRQRSRLVYDAHELYLYRFPEPTRPWTRLRLAAERALERSLARRADLILANSPDRADFMARRWRCTLPITILNGVTLSEAASPLPRPEGARLWLVHTGSLIRRGRCLDQLVRGVALCTPEVHLTFLGDGEQKAELTALANTLGISHRVHFLPPVASEKVSTAIRNADASLIAVGTSEPNYALSIPTKLLEAIAAGLPILSSRTPAMARFLAAYPVGTLWEAERPETLAQAIVQLHNPTLREAWQTALQAAQVTCGWPAQAARLIESYQQVDTH